MQMNDLAAAVEQLERKYGQGFEQAPPPELELMAYEQAAREARAMIERLGKRIAALRDEAIRGRRASGIEDIWREDEEYYEGIDDLNRDTHRFIKSAASTAGGLMRSQSRPTTKCTAFFNITRQFVDAAAARLGDILLPASDWNFSIEATPVPDEGALGKAEAALAQVPQPPGGALQGMQAAGGPMQAAGGPMQAAGGPMQVMPSAAGFPPESPVPQQSLVSLLGGAQQAPPVDPAIRNQEIAKKAEQKIHDWLTECHYHTEVRKVIESAARIGTGILKGPVPDRQVSRMVRANGDHTELMIVETIVPVSMAISVWDFYPDPNCGSNIHQGRYVFEVDRLSAKRLRELKRLPGYLPDQIDKVLEEGPNKRNLGEDRRQNKSLLDDDRYEVWYFYGDVNPADLMAMGVEQVDDRKAGIPAVVVLVNDTPIKAYLNPLESGAFPYDLFQWQQVEGSCWGIGVARQGRTPQDMLNATMRRMMDNAGLAAAPQLILRQNAIVPADGHWNFHGGKVWLATEQADIRQVGDAIMSINIPMMQPELSAIVEHAYRMMEDTTGVIMLLQGQQGSAPDTVGGMQLLHTNASAFLRRQARVFDESITEPHIRRYYEFLLLHGPDDCKGDLKIRAIGSTALVEREIQSMQALQLLQLSTNPAYGLDPAKAMAEVLKSMRFIPEKFMMDEKQRQAMAQQQAPMPQVQAAQIRAEVDAKKLEFEKWKAELDAQIAQFKIKNAIDRDLAYTQSMTERDRTFAQLRVEELRLKRELALLDYSNRRNIELEKVKSGLANTAMKLRVQKELSGVGQQVVQPPTEPVQHAPDGRAYQE